MLKRFHEVDERHRNKLLFLLYMFGLFYTSSEKNIYVILMISVAGPLFLLDVCSIIYMLMNRDA